MTLETKLQRRRERRTLRVRNRIRKSRSTRPRLSVFRSNRHMYAQIIDDEAGKTLVSASTVEKEMFGAGKFAGNKDAAAKVGPEAGRTGRSKRGSKRSCSTGDRTNTMAACRSWPMRSGRAAGALSETTRT